MGKDIDAPFVSEGLVVESDWIDYNGHMNVAYYVVAFDRAFDQCYSKLGFEPARMKAAGASMFTAELHLTYQRELKEGEPLRITTQLLDFDAKRAHFVQCMYRAGDSGLAATSEWLLLHVDIGARRVAAMPASLQARLAGIRSAHAGLPVPAVVGRAIDLANRRPA